MTSIASFAGGTAVITGAGSGLGSAMADRFASAGMAVAALDIDGAAAEATARRIREAGGKAMALAVDVADAAQLTEAAHRVRSEFGGCNVLCANVGVQQFGAVERLTEQDWQWVLDVNVMGVIRTIGAFLPLIRDTDGQRSIVVTSSSAAYSPGVRMAAYTTSKYAVTGLAETLRLELAPEGIGVSILFPAGMMTRHLESSMAARPAEFGASEFRREDVDAMMGSRRIDQDDHVATAEYATRHLLEDLAANRRYIVTHGDLRPVVNEDRAELVAAIERSLID